MKRNISLRLYNRQKEKTVKPNSSKNRKKDTEFRKGIRKLYVATPSTIERYTLKLGGAFGGPKQMIAKN